jgi:hypothetical protein
MGEAVQMRQPRLATAATLYSMEHGAERSRRDRQKRRERSKAVPKVLYTGLLPTPDIDHPS